MSDCRQFSKRCAADLSERRSSECTVRRTPLSAPAAASPACLSGPPDMKPEITDNSEGEGRQTSLSHLYRVQSRSISKDGWGEQRVAACLPALKVPQHFLGLLQELIRNSSRIPE